MYEFIDNIFAIGFSLLCMPRFLHFLETNSYFIEDKFRLKKKGHMVMARIKRFLYGFKYSQF
jgi:hypothetical protein